MSDYDVYRNLLDARSAALVVRQVGTALLVFGWLAVGGTVLAGVKLWDLLTEDVFSTSDRIATVLGTMVPATIASLFVAGVGHLMRLVAAYIGLRVALIDEEFEDEEDGED